MPEMGKVEEWCWVDCIVVCEESIKTTAGGDEGLYQPTFSLSV